MQHHTPAPERRPSLRVVPKDGRRVAPRRSSAAVLRRALAVSFAILALSGVVRITLATQATEANLNAWALRSQLDAEEQTTRDLEADVSALADPARIEQLASETLKMGRPDQVSYITIAGTAAPAGAESITGAAANVASGTSDSDDLVATLLDLAACEAQVMLVGDMGLGSGQ